MSFGRPDPIGNDGVEHWANLDPKLRTLHLCPSGAPNVARIRWGERIFQKRGSLNLLSGPQNRVSLPNKVVTSAGLSRLSVAFEIECPIVHGESILWARLWTRHGTSAAI